MPCAISNNYTHTLPANGLCIPSFKYFKHDVPIDSHSLCKHSGCHNLTLLIYKQNIWRATTLVSYIKHMCISFFIINIMYIGCAIVRQSSPQRLHSALSSVWSLYSNPCIFYTRFFTLNCVSLSNSKLHTLAYIFGLIEIRARYFILMSLQLYTKPQKTRDIVTPHKSVL